MGSQKVNVPALVCHTNQPKHRRKSTTAEESRKKIGFKYYLSINTGNNGKDKRHIFGDLRDWRENGVNMGTSNY